MTQSIKTENFISNLTDNLNNLPVIQEIKESVKQENTATPYAKIAYRLDLLNQFSEKESIISEIIERIKQEGDKPYATVAYQLELLKQLTEFDFGLFILLNKAINGYWTHYMLTHPGFTNSSFTPANQLEQFMFERAPTVKATQQRFKIFLRENQSQVKEGAKLASVACGMMGELLYLNYGGIRDIQLIGIDRDAGTFKEANQLAEKVNLTKHCDFIVKDAWQLDIYNEYDLVSSNGLHIYEPDMGKVSLLYKKFYDALKQGGKLVTSFLTFPPTLTDHYEWDLSKINQADLILQKIIFSDIIEAKWQCFRSSEQTKLQLQAAGFNDVQFIYDEAKIFPTVVAFK